MMFFNPFSPFLDLWMEEMSCPFCEGKTWVFVMSDKHVREGKCMHCDTPLLDMIDKELYEANKDKLWR